MRILIHTVGNADVGSTSGGNLVARCAALRAMPRQDAAEKLQQSAPAESGGDPRPTPLVAVLDREKGTTDYDRILLIVSIPQDENDTEFTSDLGPIIKEHLSEEWTYGRTLPADAVELLEIKAPLSSETRPLLGGWISGSAGAGHPLPDVDVSFIRGSNGAGLGLITAAIEAGTPPTVILPADERLDLSRQIPTPESRQICEPLKEIR